MNNSNVSRVFSKTLDNLRRLFRPDQQLEPSPDPECEAVHVAARVANPWQEDLDQLLANRFQSKAGLIEPLDAPYLVQGLQAKVIRKAKRNGDGTVTDLKAWWGESIATWDPNLANTIDSVEQKPHNRTLKRWFS